MLMAALPRYAKKTLPRTPPKSGETQLNDLGCAAYCTRVVWDTFMACCAKPRFRHDRARDPISTSPRRSDQANGQNQPGRRAEKPHRPQGHDGGRDALA